MQNDKELLTVAETAQDLGITTGTLANWRCSGLVDLPYCKIGRLVRYRKADVQAWIESRVRRPVGAQCMAGG